MHRFFTASLVVAIALFAVGCGKSNNEGKIVGKWKIDYAPGFDEGMVQMLAAEKIYAYIEFTPDNTCTIGVTSDDPTVRQEIAQSGEATTVRCKYKLLSGDGLEMYDMPKELQEGAGSPFGGKADRARTKAKIDGDTMTMTDDDGKTGKLTRIRDKAPPANPEVK
jgi:hypothetical protein